MGTESISCASDYAFVIVQWGRLRGGLNDGKRCRYAKRKERSEMDLTYILLLLRCGRRVTTPTRNDSPGLTRQTRAGLVGRFETPTVGNMPSCRV